MLRYLILFIFYIFISIPRAEAGKNVCEKLFSRSEELVLISKAIQTKNSIAAGPGVFARILRGKRSSHFKRLSVDRGREIVMLMDHQGINMMFNSHDPLSPLERIGYRLDYIESLKQSGTKFKMILLKSHDEILPATWVNLGLYLKRVYGNDSVVAKLYNQHLADLRAYEFEYLRMKFGEIDRNIFLAQLQKNSTLWEFRSFLYNELRLTELYHGEGYTITPNGQRGVAEYFILNQKIDEIDESELIDLN